MDVDFGGGLIMLLRWVGSVVLIIGGVAAVTLFVDWLRGASRTRAVDEIDDIDGRSTSVSIVAEFTGDSRLDEPAKVSPLDAAPAGRADDSTGAKVA